jgi:hypothetical protein
MEILLTKKQLENIIVESINGDMNEQGPWNLLRRGVQKMMGHSELKFKPTKSILPNIEKATMEHGVIRATPKVRFVLTKASNQLNWIDESITEIEKVLQNEKIQVSNSRILRTEVAELRKRLIPTGDKTIDYLWVIAQIKRIKKDIEIFANLPDITKQALHGKKVSVKNKPWGNSKTSQGGKDFTIDRTGNVTAMLQDLNSKIDNLSYDLYDLNPLFNKIKPNVATQSAQSAIELNRNINRD